MSYSHYNFEGLWFQIYNKVLALNEAMGELRLDKGQLREVTTSIFIAQTHKGIVKPYNFSKFQIEIIRMISKVNEKHKQKAIKEGILGVLGNGHLMNKEVV